MGAINGILMGVYAVVKENNLKNIKGKTRKIGHSIGLT